MIVIATKLRISRSVAVLIILFRLTKMAAAFTVHSDVLKPSVYETWPIRQVVDIATVSIDLAIFEGGISSLPPVEFDRIVVSRGRNRNAPKPYTIAEMQVIGRAWGLRPLTRKADLVEQLRVEYLRRHPV
jgi:hypothetical protein